MEQENEMEHQAEPPQAESTTEGGTNAVAKRERERAPLVAVEGGVLPIMPRSIEEAQRYASGLIQAGIVPEAFKWSERQARDVGDINLKGQPNAPLVLMGILKCLEIGVAPQTGLAGLLPLNGRFTVWGDLAAALVQRTGMVKGQKKQRIGPSFDRDKTPLGDWPDEYGWDVRYWRVGQDEPYEQQFTVGDAKRQKLWMNQYKKPWLESPDRMLFNRARAFVLRDGFADGLHGLSIAEEVMDHMPEPEATDKGSRNLSALIDEPEANGAENGEALS